MIEEGANAPDFRVPWARRKRIVPIGFRGPPDVVLYFYPKADTHRLHARVARNFAIVKKISTSWELHDPRMQRGFSGRAGKIQRELRS